MFRKGMYFIIFTILCASLFWGCSQENPYPENTSKGNGSWDFTPKVLVPEAPGIVVFQNEAVTMDASHTDQGYVMISYQGTSEKVKLQITGPDSVTYTYDIQKRGEYETFSFPSGNGDYQLTVLEQLSGTKYVQIFSQSVSVSLEDEFLPFLYPNQYVWFTPDSQAVKKASQLAEGADNEIDVISNVFFYVTDTISYDKEKARTVSPFYLPDIDQTLASETGICFDYAALMAAMLRSQGIPARLDIGYAGEIYHAWISAYTEESGWIKNIISFDGNSWKLMDPTFVSSSKKDPSIFEYIGDGTNYTVKFIY